MMKAALSTLLLVPALLASCAPSMAAPTAAPPILSEGQVWSVDVSGGTVHTVNVGTAKTRSGSSVTTYTAPLHAEGAASIEDNVGYSPAGRAPEFIILGQTRTAAGKQSAFTCVLRHPNVELNVPQVGLYRAASEPDFDRSEDAALETLTSGLVGYLIDGLRAGDTTCTATRVK